MTGCWVQKVPKMDWFGWIYGDDWGLSIVSLGSLPSQTWEYLQRTLQWEARVLDVANLWQFSYMFIMFDHVSIKHNIKYTVGGVFFPFVRACFNSPFFKTVRKKPCLGPGSGCREDDEGGAAEVPRGASHMTSRVGTLGSSCFAGSLVSDNLIQLQELGGHNKLNHLNQAF